MFAALFRHQKISGTTALAHLVTEKLETSKVSARLMNPDELETVFNIIDQEEWNLCLTKFRLMSQHMPGVTYVLVDEQDHIVGTFGLTQTVPGEYVLGNVVVTTDMRGKGLGRRILQEFSHTVNYTVLSLTAVPDAVQFYKNVGLETMSPPCDQTIFHVKVNLKLVEERMAKASEELKNITVGRMDKSRLQDLLAYDSVARGYDSSAHTTIIAEYTNILVAEETSSKKIVGWAGPFLHRGEVVLDGLMANSDAIALALFRASMAEFPAVVQAKVQTPKSQPLLGQLGEVTSTYDYVVFVDGPASQRPQEKVYCVTDCDYSQ